MFSINTVIIWSNDTDFCSLYNQVTKLHVVRSSTSIFKMWVNVRSLLKSLIENAKLDTNASK